MELSFAKLHGLGNDFVFIDDRDCALDLTDEQVSYLCDRHFGIGADGVILVRPALSEEGDGYMHYINADGTLAQMCGQRRALLRQVPRRSRAGGRCPRAALWPTPWPARALSPFPWMRRGR